MPTDPWSLIQQAADIRGADRHASLIGYEQAAGAARDDPSPAPTRFGMSPI